MFYQELFDNDTIEISTFLSSGKKVFEGEKEVDMRAATFKSVALH